MPSPYQIDLTASQINTALNNAWDSDQQPALGQSNLCNSDKIAAAIVGAVEAEASIRAAADTAVISQILSEVYVGAVGWLSFTDTVATTQYLAASASQFSYNTTIDTNTCIITVGVSGLYEVIINSGSATSSSNGGATLELHKNNSNVWTILSVAQYVTSSVTNAWNYLSFTAGDTIRLYGTNVGGGSVSATNLIIKRIA